MNKRNSLFLISIVLVISLLYGCGEEDEVEKILGEDTSGVYTGFMKMKGGEWAEYTTESGIMRNEFIGTDTHNGRKCTVLEIESIISGEKTISQIWIDLEKGDIILYVQKIQNIVYKLDFQSLPKDIPITKGDDTPDNYPVSKQIRTDTYKTPTGKEVKVAVFKSTYGEDWVSSEVPFGIVKSVAQNGVASIELYDFGTSGAKRDISKDEAENAKSIFDFGDFDFDE
ncbi:MAG: hypothetical protein ACUVWN_03870 [bacterium]